MSVNTMRELLDILLAADLAKRTDLKGEITLTIDAKAVASLNVDVFQMTVAQFLEETNAQAALVFSTTAPHGGGGGGGGGGGLGAQKPANGDDGLAESKDPSD